MNRIILSIVLITIALSCRAEQLPRPRITGGMPLMEAINHRATLRDIDPSLGISRQELSNLLWVAWGITHDDKHTVATAMNRKELVIYVITPTEASRYNPDSHTLTTVNTGDFRDAAGRQDFARQAPLNIVLAVDTSLQEREEFQSYAPSAASQNIYLYCASEGLKTVVRAMFDRERLPEVLHLPENEKIIWVQTVGR